MPAGTYWRKAAVVSASMLAVTGRHPRPLRRHLDGHFSRHRRPLHAPVRLLLILIMVPLQVLSGGSTPRESMPELVQQVMLVAPTTHFVLLAQAILHLGAGLETVWPQFLALAAIGGVLFGLALSRFRKTIGQMA